MALAGGKEEEEEVCTHGIDRKEKRLGEFLLSLSTNHQVVPQRFL